MTMAITEKELQALEDSRTKTAYLYYKGILYGEFGVRKTTTALRCSRKRAILLHADRGWAVIKNHPEEFNDDNVIPLRYEGLSQIKTVLRAVAENIEPYNDVDLIVLDTVSQMQEEYLDFLVDNTTVSGKDQRVTATAKPGVKIDGPMATPSFPDYHLTKRQFSPVIDALIKADVNVLFLAHIREPGPLETTLLRRPNVIDSVYKILSREATFMGFMSKHHKDGYQVDFEPKATLAAKSQIKKIQDTKIKSDDLPQVLWDWQDQK